MENVPNRAEIRLSGTRLLIADKLQKSLQETAQLSFHTECDATRLVEARRAGKEQGIVIGFEDLIIRSLCNSLQRYPQFNSAIEGKAAIISEVIHVSVAIALQKGLVAPTIFNAQAKSLREVSQVRTDLIARARRNQLTVREMTGGTITISNLGATRVKFFTPILNPPQMAILGIGQIASRPWVNMSDQICVRPVLGLSLTVDHRFIDGEPAGAFLTDLSNELETGTPFVLT